MSLENKPTRGPTMELIGSRGQQPGHYRNMPSEESLSSDSGVTSPGASRRRMTSLLEEAFSLISPTGQRNLVGPVPPRLVQPAASPVDMTRAPMHHPDGRTADPHPRTLVPALPPPSLPPPTPSETPQPLFTRTHLPLVFLPNNGEISEPRSYAAPARGGTPVYITPTQQVTDDRPHMTPGAPHPAAPTQNYAVPSTPQQAWGMPMTSTTVPGSIPPTHSYFPQSSYLSPPHGHPAPPYTQQGFPQNTSSPQSASTEDPNSSRFLLQSIRDEIARLNGSSTV